MPPRSLKRGQFPIRRRLGVECLEERRMLSIVPRMVKDIRDGNESAFATQNLYGEAAEVNNLLYFAADDGSSGKELWRSDGSDSGTLLVADLLPGPEGSEPRYLTNVNGTLFFTANDGKYGRGLWKSDGTERGTVLLKSVWPAPQYGKSGSPPSHLTSLGDTLFFVADDGESGKELWRSDGTPRGTVLVKDISPGIYTVCPMSIICFDYPNSSTPDSFSVLDNTLFFSATNKAKGRELWKTDGTEDGTVMVKDVRQGADGSNPAYLTNVDEMLFFRSAGTHGRELWKSDGTNEGTVRVKEFTPSGCHYGISYESNFTAVNSKLFFVAGDCVHGPELWMSDGTVAGTFQAKDIWPGSTLRR